MRTSGLVLDFYDDSRGEVLREMFPTKEDIPEVIKEAQTLSSGDREALPDDVFALVLINGEDKLRKYACVDEGNTILSIGYFLKNAHKLPAEAQKTAAVSLMTACSWYDITPPEPLEKIALAGFIARRAMANPLGALQTAYTVPAVAKGVGQEMGMRNEVARAAGGAVVTPEQLHHALGRTKHAEVTGTADMPLSAPVPKKQPNSSTVKNAMGRLVAGHKGKTADLGPIEKNPQPDGRKNITKLPQMHMRPHVEVTKSAAPRPLLEQKVASVYALGSKYPLDSYAQVQTAIEYFDNYQHRFQPADRHEYCVNLVKRASALGIEVSDQARKYGSETYAPYEELKMAFDSRKGLLHDPDVVEQLEHLSKLAADATYEPGVVCAALEELDKQAGLNYLYDSDVPDPYFSVYGFEKNADEYYSWSDANDHVTAQQLKELGLKNRRGLKRNFNEDFSDEFAKDPVGMFKSMPLPQKRLISRMAQEPASPLQNAT